METTVVKLNFNVKYRETGKRTLIHHALETFLNCWEKVLRYVTAHNE